MRLRQEQAQERLILLVMDGRPQSGISISWTESVYLLVAIVTLSLAFTYFFGFSTPGLLIGVVLGVVMHELGHKFVAQSMGFKSEFRLWSIGLVLVIAFALISKGKFIFAAPGYVVTEGMATVRQKGLISLAAPASNILLALFFLAVPLAWGRDAAMVNVLLAIFNLVPIAPLDGAPVIQWSEGIWASVFVFSLLLGLVFLL